MRYNLLALFLCIPAYADTVAPTPTKPDEPIAKALLRVGIRPWLDKWNLIPGESLFTALERAIETIPCGVLFFGPADTGKWHILEINAYLETWASANGRLIPVILPGVKETPKLPIFVRQALWVDMRDWEQPDSDAFYRLICGIVNRPPGDAALKKLSARNVYDWQLSGVNAF